jgi:hypothetical protein
METSTNIRSYYERLGSRMHNKIIFLDIDGVLATFEGSIDMSIGKQDWTPEILESYGVKLRVHTPLTKHINTILMTTSARIVLTSTWRLGTKEAFKERKGYLESYLIPGSIIDRTTHIKDGTRGDEIRLWLDHHPKVTNYVVIDDSNEKYFQKVINHLVRTDHKIGIQKEDVQKAIDILDL